MTEPLPAILDGWEQPVTAVERAALAADPHVSLSSHEPGEFGGTCPDCMAALRYIRKLRTAMEPVLAAARDLELAEAGRLLPEGAEHLSHVVLRWYLVDGAPEEWGGPDDWSVADARESAKQPPPGAVRGEIRQREHWLTRYVVVEQVQVAAAQEGLPASTGEVAPPAGDEINT